MMNKMSLKIYSRPDTDDIERKEKKHYKKAKNLTFKLCRVCGGKPGSPTLCAPCYHNRRVILELRRRLGLTEDDDGGMFYDYD
jgi:hypothetical protein